MPVNNLQPGGVMNVAAAQIQGTAYVYRTGQGYDTPGNVGWAPAGGAVQVQPIAVGETVSFPINGQAGMIANGAPSMVQVLWVNGAPGLVRQTETNAAAKLLRTVKSKAARAAPATGAGPVAVSDGPAEQVMSTLNAQWYNAVVSGCGLDPTSFQLVQGSSPLVSTSEALWNIADAVPPLSVSHYFNPSQLNVFSADYGAVINNLKYQNAQAFQNDMGDYFAAWMTYQGTLTTLPAGGLPAAFQTWANIHMPPDQAMQCYTDFLQIYQGVVPTAVQMWVAAGGLKATKAYNATISQLQGMIPSAPSKSFTLETATASADISHTWAQVEAGGILDFFEAGGDSSYDQLTETFSQSGLSISVTFNSLLTFPLGPLSKTSSDPILSTYQPWFSSPALNLAYNNNNNIVWKNGAPTWANTFGPTGNMLRTASALVVVDGISITMTCDTAFSTDQQTQVKSAAEAGFWPFFEAEGSGGWTNNASFDESGFMTITSICPAGNPNILGVIVTPIAGAMMI
jgi:hypothetical protein